MIFNTLQKLLRDRRLYGLLALSFAAWAVANPARFVGLWLTPDQQGWLLFQRHEYERAARAFSDPRWRGTALYAAQDFSAAAQYFSQYQDPQSLLARANALAHQREYLDARDLYRDLAQRFPGHPAPAVNLPIVQALIDANRALSESQASELGDLSSTSDEGPRSSEGDERMSFAEREQLNAEQLLEDPALTRMWLRQVQRDPAEFLANKFYQQLNTPEQAQ
jgi:Ca-activated chloride channel family protein